MSIEGRYTDSAVMACALVAASAICRLAITLTILAAGLGHYAKGTHGDRLNIVFIYFTTHNNGTVYITKYQRQKSLTPWVKLIHT